MQPYLDLLRDVRQNGVRRPTRAKLKSTGENIDALSVFGRQVRYDLSEGFPLVTTKKVNFDAVVHELIWFLRGDTNVRYLEENGVRIWSDWRKPDLNAGPPSSVRPLVWVPKRTRTGPGIRIVDPLAKPMKRDQVDAKLYETWYKVMRRCYEKSSHNYKYYGGRGVTVAEEWHNANTFIQDVKQIPNWRHKLIDWADYNLDKDYYASNCYSKETSVWLHYTENAYYTKTACPIRVTPPGKTPKTYISSATAARDLGITDGSINRLVRGTNKTETLKQGNKRFSGWRFDAVKPRPGMVLRHAFSKGDLGPIYGAQWRRWKGPHGETVDQIANLLDGIREASRNPTASIGRRLILSAWNVSDLAEMALVPCHHISQFHVADGRLSCLFNMRSCDLFLGAPFNIASYALLTHLLAGLTGLKPGELIHSIGDAHIYCNHLDQVDEQLKREPLPPPTLRLDLDGIEIPWDVARDRVFLDNYVHHPALRGEVAV